MAARRADIIQVLGASFGTGGAVVNDLSSFCVDAFEERVGWISDAAGDRFGGRTGVPGLPFGDGVALRR